jgi:hypothetical protein
MIEQNELRLGNLIIEDGKKTQFNGDFYHWCGDIMKPIELTEEWIIKFKFRKHKNDIRYWQKDSLKVKLTEKGYKFQWYEAILYIDYVHQLQNLYFALTGSELHYVA